MAQTGTVCQYYSVALHKFFVHCHIFVDLCQITLGQALAHRSRMSLRRFCQLVCYSIKEAIPFEPIPLNAMVCGMLLLQLARLDRSLTNISGSVYAFSVKKITIRPFCSSA
jgi:hypothetical protein